MRPVRELHHNSSDPEAGPRHWLLRTGLTQPAVIRRKPSMKNPLALAAATFVLSLFAVVAAWGYTTLQQERELPRDFVPLVADASVAVRSALASGNSTVRDVERELSAAEARVEKLHGSDASRRGAAQHAAEGYLVAVRDLLRRQLEMTRARERLPARTEAFAAHMRARDAGAAPDEALRLKGLVDDEFHAYRTAVEGYLSLLRTLPQTQAAIRPYVPSHVLVDDGVIERAKNRALDAFAAVNHETRVATDLDSYTVKPAAASAQPARGAKAKTRSTAVKKGKATRATAQRASAKPRQKAAAQKRSAAASQKQRGAGARAKPPSPSRKSTSGGSHGAGAKSGSRNRSGQRDR
jgi:hypothetical protein